MARRSADHPGDDSLTCCRIEPQLILSTSAHVPTGWPALRRAMTIVFQSKGSSRPGHEGVDHSFLARLVEVDAELVAFDGGDDAIAEFLVEDALAAGIDRTLRVGGLDSVRLAFDQRWPGAHAAACRAIGLRPFPAR